MNVFISYSHKNKNFLPDLVTQLKILQNSKRITRYWNDENLNAGEDFNEEIACQIRRSQIIVLLISSEYIASDYIKDKEFPLILDRYKNGHAVIIPVIIRACEFLNLLPAGMYVLAFNPRERKDVKWQKVYNEIEKHCAESPVHSNSVPTPEPDLTPPDIVLNPIANLTTPMIGRKTEINLIIKSVKNQESVIITGHTGVGKSTLVGNAIKKSAKSKSKYFDLFHYTDLSQRREPADLLRSFIKDLLLSLHYSTFESEDINYLFNFAANIMKNRVLLLFFDNADELPALEAIREIRPRLSNPVVLVTSQHNNWRILKPIRHIEVAGLSKDEGLRLFKTDYKIPMDKRQEELVCKFIDQVHGNPLIIESYAKDGQKYGFANIEPAISKSIARPDREIFNRFKNRYDLLSNIHKQILELAGFLEKPLISITLATVAIPCKKQDLEQLRDQGLINITPSDTHYYAPGIYHLCCSELVIKMNIKDLQTLASSVISYYGTLLDTKKDIIAEEWPNLTKIIDNYCESSDEVVYFIDQAIGDHLDDPNGFIPKQQHILYFIDRQERILRRARSLPQPQRDLILARVEKNFGIFNYIRGDYKKAKELCLNAKQRYCAQQSLIGEIVCNYLLGQIAEDQNDYHAAERYYDKGIKLSKTKKSDALLLGLGYYHLGCVHYHMGQYENAQKHFKEASVDETVDQDLYARIQRRIGSVLISLGKYEQAEAFFNNLEVRITRLLRRRDLARISQKQALLFLHLKDLAKARAKIDDALHIFSEELQDQRRIGSTHLLLAKWHLENKDQVSALAQCQKSLDYASDTQSYLGIARAYEERAKILEITSGLNQEAIEMRRRAYCYYSVIHHQRVDGRNMADFCKKGPYLPQPVKGVIFDLIDTLASFSHKEYETNHQEYAHRLGIDPDCFNEAWNSSREFAQRGIFNDTRERMVWVANKIGIKETDAIISWLAKTEETMWIKNVEFLTDAKEVIKNLGSRGIKIAILANGPAALKRLRASLKLDSLKAPLFLSCEQVYLKPEMSSYMSTLEALGIQSDVKHCVFVGDGTDKELNGARECGLYAVRMKHARPPYTTQDNESTDWDWEVNDLRELQHLLLN